MRRSSLVKAMISWRPGASLATRCRHQPLALWWSCGLQESPTANLPDKKTSSQNHDSKLQANNANTYTKHPRTVTRLSPQQLCCGRCLPIRFIVLFFQQSLGAHFGRNVDNPLACPRSSSVRVCASLHAIRQLSFFVAASRTTYQSLSHREASFRAPSYDNLDNLAKCPCPPKPGL